MEMIKKKTCWRYVRHGKCNHVNNIQVEGKNIRGYWHPKEDERDYLIKKALRK